MAMTTEGGLLSRSDFSYCFGHCKRLTRVRCNYIIYQLGNMQHEIEQNTGNISRRHRERVSSWVISQKLVASGPVTLCHVLAETSKVQIPTKVR
jgi:hypothetical protein